MASLEYLAELIVPTERFRHWSSDSVLGLVLGLLLGAGGLLTWRQLTGAMPQTAPVLATLGVVSLVTAALTAVRCVWRAKYPLNAQRLADSWQDWAIGWGTSLAMILWAVGCSYPFTNVVASCLWIPLVIIDQFARQQFFDAGDLELQVGAGEPELDYPVDLSADSSTCPDWTEQPACLQEVFRVVEEDGREAVYACVAVDFAAEQRHASAHVGFCPPLAFLPEIEAEPSDGPPCKVKVVSAFAHGARIDLRLGSPAEEPFRMMLDLAARAPQAASA